MAFFDLFAGKKESQELEYVLDRNIKPLKGYIQGKEFEEALQALHNAILNIMKHLESNIQSDAYYLNEEEVKRVFSQTSGSWRRIGDRPRFFRPTEGIARQRTAGQP